MKRFLCTAAALTLLAPATVMAQDNQIQASGGFRAGVQAVDVDGSTAKFNEYRDIRDGFYLYDLDFEAIDTSRGLYLDFRGKNVTHDDQRLNFGLGSFGSWGLEVERNEIPKRISDKAKTPYAYQGDGLFTVPAVVPIREQNPDGLSLVPAGAAQNNAIQQANDALIADYLGEGLNSVTLGTQRKRDSVSLSASPIDFLKIRLTYTDERKDGSKVTYGPIGDRPPRTQNIQLPEPIDFRTRELKAEADLLFDGIQGRVAYQLSDFNNNIDSMSWENIFFSPEAGENFAIESNGNRRVASFGQRALDPDNRYHNISGSVGIDLPLESRLTASAAYGWMKQDQGLLPYTTLNFVERIENLIRSDVDPSLDAPANPEGLSWNDIAKLPRQSADAEINTTLFNLDYTINPVERLNLRPFFRYYDLDNKTDSDEWRYVTQDTVGAGGPNYRSYRINLPYAYDKMNYGLDARYTLAFWRTTLGLGYEREEIDRDFREADTDENIYKISVRTQPTDIVFIRASYLYGDRESKGYNYNVTEQSYWYSIAQANNDVDNPKYLFGNHPDLRKYDVSDRERNQFDISANVTPLQALDLGANYSYRKDDFGSGVAPVAPLADAPAGGVIVEDDRFLLTPGVQLGLLEEERQNYGLNAYYAPTSRWHVSAFANREEIDSTVRGMVFNENQRRNPTNAGIFNVPTALGPWTDDEVGRIFTNKMEDRTNTVGIGGGYEIVPGKIKLSADYTLSRGKVAWDYSGYGTDIPDSDSWDTFQFGFRSPQTVKNNQYTLSAALEYQFVQNLVFGLHYLFDRFSMDDWMVEGEGPWVEQVGSEYFLRDTSRDNRWGNRLVNMGTPLWGNYEAHVGYVTMSYRF